MKAFFVSLAVIFFFACTPESNKAAGDGITWITDYQQGITAARESNKSAMIFFTADWCPPCVELKKQVFADARVVTASKALVNIYVDVDQNRRTMSDYRVREIPAIFFLTAHGQTIAKFSGPRTVQNIIKQMKAAAEAAAGS